MIESAKKKYCHKLRTSVRFRIATPSVYGNVEVYYATGLRLPVNFYDIKLACILPIAATDI